MALWIVNDALASQVQKDLRAIYPFPGMTIAAKTGSFSVLEVLVANPPTPSTIATLIAAVVAAPTTVTVQGSMSSRVIGTSGGTPVPISSVGGLTVPDTYPGPSLINILYDCEGGKGCSGRGRFAEGTTPGSTVDAPTDVVMFHELVHAFHFITNGFSGPPQTTAEADALPVENTYRGGRQLGARGGHGGGCNSGPPTTTSPSKGSSKSGGKSCFTGGTRIAMADGEEKPIELIREGDLVLGKSGHPNRVIAVERPILGDRKLYALNGGSPFVTAEHPIMTATGWKSIDPSATEAENPLLIVKRLMVNDALLCLKGCAVSVGPTVGKETAKPQLESISLVSMGSQHADPGTTVYNLLLEGDHTYFANGFLVHNKCFIATAVLDTAYAARLDEIRIFRDSTILSTPRAAAYIDTFYSCYRNIGSQMAEEIERDTEERKSLLTFVVMPVVSYLTLAIRCPEQAVDLTALPPAWGHFFGELICGLEYWAISAMPPQIKAPTDDIEFILRYVLRRDTSRVVFRESLIAGEQTPALHALISNASAEFSRVIAYTKDLDGLLDRSKAAQNPLAVVAKTLLRDTAIKDLERLRCAFDDAGLHHIFDTAFVGPLVNYVRLCAALPLGPIPAELSEEWQNVLTLLQQDLQYLMKSIFSLTTPITITNVSNAVALHGGQQRSFEQGKLQADEATRMSSWQF